MNLKYDYGLELGNAIQSIYEGNLLSAYVF